MKALIRQQSGLGDILYLQKVVYKLNEKYNLDKIIWPLDELYAYVKEYLKVPSNVYFINDKEEFEYKDIYDDSENKDVILTEDLIYIPFQFSHEKKYNNLWRYIMQAKYEFIGLNGADWFDYVNIIRNKDKEQQLFNLVVGKTSSPYIIVNKSFGPITMAKTREDINPLTDYKTIHMKHVEGFTPFDWSLIFEHAQEIHTVETSIPYILRALNLDNVSIYYRILNKDEIKYNPYHPWVNFEYCKFIHSNPKWSFEKI